LKPTDFTDILNNKKPIQQVETAELKTVVEEFPFFQSARALYLKGLKNQDSFKYNNELKLTAAHTTDRTVLFEYITSKNFNEKEESIHQKITEKIVETAPEKAKVTKIEPEEKTTAATELNIGKPISFSTSESFSFNQWLQLSVKKPIKQVIEKEEPVSEKEEIIDRFIENNPKIEPLQKDKKVTVSVTENKQDSSLMTETLAQVYLEQKKYENAIQAYRILSLKYPEKSGFFADQIKRVQILQKHKS